MPYRDELAQLTQTLAEKSAALEATTERAVILEREREEMKREVEVLASRVERARRRLHLFEDVRVASPCPEPWDGMEGDDRVRFCGRCEKHVFNLSSMTTAEVDRFVTETTGEACIRFYRRADGMMLTQDCQVGARSNNIRRAIAAVGIGATLAGVGTMGLGAMTMTQGAMDRGGRAQAEFERRSKALELEAEEADRAEQASRRAASQASALAQPSAQAPNGPPKGVSAPKPLKSR